MDTNVIIDKDVILITLGLAFLLKTIVFILGFFTIKMGHSLIREGVKGDFKFTTETKGIKGGLQSSSPGLLFVLLGIILIGYAMFIDKGVTYDSLTSNENKKSKNVSQFEQDKDASTKPEIEIDTTRIKLK